VTGAVKAVTEFERNLGKGKDGGDPTFSIYKKNKFSCVGDVFPLDRGLLMGDPFVFVSTPLSLYQSQKIGEEKGELEG
jgi:hypothetical protein